LCHFTPTMHDTGLLKLSRGEFALTSTDEGFTSAGASVKTSSGVELWSVEEAQLPPMLPETAVFLRHGGMRFGPFQREDLPNGLVRLQSSDAGYLRISPQNGLVEAVGGGGPPCQFEVQTSDGQQFKLRSEADPFRFLGVSPWGALTGRDVAAEKQTFCWESVEVPPGTPVPLPSLVTGLDFDESVDLTQEQRQSFMDDGYLIIKGAVQPCLVAAALSEINRSLLKPGSVVHTEDGKTKHCSDIASSDTVMALLYATQLWTLAQRLMGRGCVAKVNGAQIALRAPDSNAVPLEVDEALPPQQWHIDGMHNPEAQYSGFSLLVGVALSDQKASNCGNLIAFTGSHHMTHPIVRQEAEKPGSYPFLQEKGSKVGMPALSCGRQMLLGVGDAVLLHQKTAHRVGINCSPDIRYQAYFRLKHIDHAAHLADGSIHQGLWRQFAFVEEGPLFKQQKVKH